MARFTDYLDSLGVGDGGAVMYPETFQDDIRGAYDSDIQGASAQIALLTEQVATLEAQNTQLAAANWNLSQSIPANGTIEEPDPEEDMSNSEDDDPDTSDFFE